jgi:hypothetical protein
LPKVLRDDNPVLTAAYPGVVVQRAAYGFGSSGDPGHEFGPSGLAFGTAGSWLVANGGTGELFRLDGIDVAAVDPLNPDAGVLDLAVGQGGELYGSRGSEIVEIDVTTGHITHVVAQGFAELTGLAADHRSGLLLAADFGENAIWEVAPATGTKQLRARDERLGSPDGIVLDEEGTLFVAGYDSKHIVAVARDGSIDDLGYLAGGPDGIALGYSGGLLGGCLVVNQRDGLVVARRPGGSVVVLAGGGSPGDLLAVDRRGLLYVTQQSEVVVLGPAWFAPQPWRYLPA